MNAEEQNQTELAEIALDQEVPLYSEQRSDSIYQLIVSVGARRVLDVGCGLGKVTVYLAQKGIEVVGIDISTRLISLARKKAQEHSVPVDFQVTELSRFNSTEKFDVVLFAGVIEHIGNDEKIIGEAKRLLKKEGKIIITVPAFPLLYNNRDKRIGHLRRYTKKTLGEKLRSQGYTNIQHRYYGFLVIFGALYLILRKKDEYPYGQMGHFTQRLIQVWYKYLENNFIFPVGEHLYTTAQLQEDPG